MESNSQNSSRKTRIIVLTKKGNPSFLILKNWRDISADEIDLAVRKRYGYKRGRKDHDWNFEVIY